MNLRGKLEIVARTDTGRMRARNEDRIEDDIGIGAVVLADGMGGYKGGDVASAIAVNTILAELRTVLPVTESDAVDAETGYTGATLAARRSIINANNTIYQTAQSQPQYRGMGTTVVLAVFYDNRMTLAHVGDSRMYRYREGHLEQITADHTLVQELVDRGLYTQDQARASIDKNLVTRALGVEPTVIVDVQEHLVRPGDTYLMCSDGLYEMVADREILAILKQHPAHLEQAARQLIQQANEQGGKDNISVILTRILKPFPARKGWRGKLTNLFT